MEYVVFIYEPNKNEICGVYEWVKRHGMWCLRMGKQKIEYVVFMNWSKGDEMWCLSMDNEEIEYVVYMHQ